MKQMMAEVGIIGGSGIYDPSIFEDTRELNIDTPFGRPSDNVIIGRLGEREVAFISRHGKGHLYSPTKVNYRANIFALKKLGVKSIIGVCAVGSLKEEIKPLDIVIPDQIYDRTKYRKNTFFDDIVVHVGFAEPFCKRLSDKLYEATKKMGYRVRLGGTYLCIEGPQFSTKAESNVYRKLGFDIVGMTAIPEAKLAREAEICYATLATVTDYDVWKEEEVSVSEVVENVMKNAQAVKDILKEFIPLLAEGKCGCRDALKDAIVTDLSRIDSEKMKKLEILIGRYIK
ncbi:MAG: S-methyl-5'-thioadenosine phosphorylase [Candidatus Methanolliviera sp. GoM_asphalt]|nr:MAG: S-methyl-5'-thioadenosine phosphorylase [Candidatus Methanolliviera sp. GoM_asphalt]